VWTYTEVLYGTDESSEEIVAFYRPWMQSQGRYEEREHGGYFVDSEGVSMSLDTDPTIAAHIPYSVLSDARRNFATVYLIEVFYGSPSTWKHCSVVELPTAQPQ